MSVTAKIDLGKKSESKKRGDQGGKGKGGGKERGKVKPDDLSKDIGLVKKGGGGKKTTCRRLAEKANQENVGRHARAFGSKRPWISQGPFIKQGKNEAYWMYTRPMTS